MKAGKIIVISREYGSAGRIIGQKLAEAYGIPFYDRNFVEQAVENAGLSADFLEEEDQKFISSLLFNLATGGYRHGNDKLMADQVFLAEQNAIRQVAEKGSCVIVGRCADQILKDNFDVFSLFIHAPLSVRVKRAVEEYGIDKKRAEQIVKEKDRSRARHYEYYTDRSWGDCNNYHLCLDSSLFGLDGTVKLIQQALELA